MAPTCGSGQPPTGIRGSFTNVPIFYLVCKVEEQIEYQGYDIVVARLPGPNPDPIACANLCFQEFDCTHWTLFKWSLECVLKTSDAGRRPSTNDFVSGNKECGNLTGN